MAQEGSFYFSIPEMEAIVLALENCGINSGNSGEMLEYFRDPSLVKAALSVRRKLRGKGLRMSGKTGIQDDTDPGAIEELSKKLSESNAENRRLVKDRNELVERIKAIKGPADKEHIQLVQRKLDDLLTEIKFGQFEC